MKNYVLVYLTKISTLNSAVFKKNPNLAVSAPPRQHRSPENKKTTRYTISEFQF
jgi:hypothetical protein